MRTITRSLPLFAIFVPAASEKIDLLVTNANIYTVDSQFTGGRSHGH